MEGPLVSIIIPIYKVEQYLEHCLSTVCNQTYKNIEVILVNDGSPDDSGIIARKYAQEDSRFKYFEKENGGLSSARNCGIDLCKGDYISFVDSDDWLEPEFVQKLLDIAQKYDADISVCNMKYIYQDGSERTNVPKIREEKCVSNIGALSDLFNSRFFRNHAQNKLYRSRLFKETGIRYPLGKLYEDVFTTYRLFYEANKIAYIPLNLYDYLQARPGSILNSGFSKRQLDILDGIDEIGSFIDRHEIYDSLKDDYTQLVVSNILAIANFVYPTYFNMEFKEKEYIKGVMKETRERYSLQNYMRNSNLTMGQKIRYFTILNAFDLYCFGMKVIRK